MDRYITSNVSETYSGLLSSDSFGPESEQDLPIIDEEEIKLALLKKKEVKYSIIAKGILKGALPSMIQFFSALFVNNTTLHFVSMKNDVTFFNGVALAVSILNCFCFYLIFHGNIGFNAAASQALGAQNTKLVGIYLHRALIIHLIVNICAYGFIIVAPYLFRLIGVDSTLTKVAFDYLVLCPGYILGVIVFDTLKNYLYAHKIFSPLVIIQIIIAVAYWFLNNLFFITWDMQIKGIIFAITISQWIGPIILLGYLFIIKPKAIQNTWFWFERASFRGFGPLGKIMITIGGMGYIEVFAYRILSFASTYFAPQQMAAFTAFLALGDLYYVIPMGVAIPLTVFLGNAMGSRDKTLISKTIKLTLILSVILLVTMLIVFAIFKENIFAFYAQDAAVKDIMAQIGILYFVTFPADFIQNLLAGIIKGVGKEKIGTKVFMIALYAIGLPLALIFGFWVDLQAFGMWLGNGIGIYCAMLLFMWVIVKTDLSVQFDFVSKRMKGNKLSSEAISLE